MHSGTLVVEDFSSSVVQREFGASCASLYLHDYLSYLGASAILLEPHYVDRHYLDDFANYYARSFDPPDPWCSRFHFFSGHDKAQLEGLFSSAFTATGGPESAEKMLNDAYLGFVVKRPLVGAAMGRTVLKTYPVERVSGEVGRRHHAPSATWSTTSILARTLTS